MLIAGGEGPTLASPSNEWLRDQGEGDIDVNDRRAAHQHHECENGGEPGQNGKRNCKDAKERDNQPVDWVEKSHGTELGPGVRYQSAFWRRQPTFGKLSVYPIAQSLRY